MKILGNSKQSYGDPSYIVEISHSEIKAVADKAYHDKLDELKVGTEYPISEGHDFRNEILKAVKDMEKAHESFQKASLTMARFVRALRVEE